MQTAQRAAAIRGVGTSSHRSSTAFSALADTAAYLKIWMHWYAAICSNECPMQLPWARQQTRSVEPLRHRIQNATVAESLQLYHLQLEEKRYRMERRCLSNRQLKEMLS